MAEDLGLDLFALDRQFRVVLQACRQVSTAAFELRTKIVIGVLIDLAKEPIDRVVDLQKDAVIDRFGDPPRRLVAQTIAQHLAVVLEEVLNSDQC